jgi:hypothetical protein
MNHDIFKCTAAPRVSNESFQLSVSLEPPRVRLTARLRQRLSGLVGGGGPVEEPGSDDRHVQG